MNNRKEKKICDKETVQIFLQVFSESVIY